MPIGCMLRLTNFIFAHFVGYINFNIIYPTLCFGGKLQVFKSAQSVTNHIPVNDKFSYGTEMAFDNLNVVSLQS